MSGEEVLALADSALTITSEGLRWDGIHVEAGCIESWAVDDLAPTDHYLAVNTDDQALTFEVKRGRRTQRVVMPPGSLWLCPAGESFSHRVATPAAYTLLTIAPERIARTTQTPLALEREYAIELPPLTHLLQALVEEIKRGGAGGPAFADAVGTAAILALEERYRVGHSPNAAANAARGGLSRRTLGQAVDLIESRLGDGVTVEEMAAEVGLSTAHFSRAFKTSVGRSPYQELMRRRIERARQAILAGAPSLSAVAMRYGFSDQAHMTRLMKRQLGVTPGALARSR